MLRNGFFAVLGVLFVGTAIAWGQLGPFNGPSRSPPRDQWEVLLRERIKLPKGYKLEVFARDLGQPRLMQMTAEGDLIVSGYRDGTILVVKADSDGDGRSDWQGVLREGLNQPHGLLLEGRTLFVAEEQRVMSYEFDGVKLGKERVVLEGIPGEDGHSSRTLNAGLTGYSICQWFQLQFLHRGHILAAAIIRFKEVYPEILPRAAQHRGLTAAVDGGAFCFDNGATFWVTMSRRSSDRMRRQHDGWPFVHCADVAATPSFYSATASGLARFEFH